MRSVPISIGEYYHVFNRGVNKQNIFTNKTDFSRFLFSILYLQSPTGFNPIARLTKHFVEHSVFNVGIEDVDEIIRGRYVELVSFCLMPNHFHLLLKETAEGGIARYMQRILNGYTKYFNSKYEKSGHLFQGPYRAVHVESNEQLLHLSAYIHRNPRELTGWKNRERVYPWSSCQDLIGINRWGTLLTPAILLEQFTQSTYADFLESSPAKKPVQHRVLNR